MLQFEGDRDFALSPEQLFAHLSDCRFLVLCIPDADPPMLAEEKTARCVVRPGFAFIRGSLDLTLTLSETRPPQADNPAFVRLTLDSKGIGMSSVVETVLTLKPSGTGTRVQWSAEVKHLGGLLKMVPHGLIRGAAQKVIEDVWQTIARKLL